MHLCFDTWQLSPAARKVNMSQRLVNVLMPLQRLQDVERQDAENAGAD